VTATALRHTTIGVILVLSVVIVAGCPKKKDIKKSPEQLYNEGICFMGRRKGGNFLNPPDYEKAREAFMEIVYEHPTSRYAPPAELRIADSYYEAGDYLSSAELFEQWRRQHIGRLEVPYSIYRAAMSYYHLVLSKDRDQSYTRQALSKFRYLISSYPESEYARAVGEKTNVLEVRLARHEMYVGKFYFRHRHWWAAVDRYQTVLDQYSKKGFDEEAMFYMWRAYRKLGRFEESTAVYHRMVKRFPNGEWIRRAKELESTQKRKGARTWLGP